ncbi:MAG: glycoside hydrolase family 38 N-terminal domain-containing protein [Anaerolineae bacterium]
MAEDSVQPRYSAHYISGTHWDREWYRPLQEFRFLLVQVMDQLLGLMEQSSDFRYFHLDGQTCVLADYGEVRPENKPRLQKLMSEGRVLVGPWFTMPDLFCPGDDEALVRNLLLGRRIAHEWNVEPMAVAYTCDMFGHPSQMPQIYRGFGLPYCVLGRGTNEHTTPAFFTWEAPDGSRVFSFKLQDDMGYGAFVGSRNILEHAEDPDAPEVEAKAKDSMRKYAVHEMTRANGPVLCLMDALDHTPPATDAARYLRLLHEAVPNVDAVHSTLPAFFAEAAAKATDVPVKRGELREPGKRPAPYLWLIPNCVSARVRMKQANDAAESLLERWAEPWLGLANLQGAGLPERFLRLAWEQVLLCHAHDSICGCSIDQVHRDMMFRFDQARLLALQLRHQAFGAITRDCADLAQGEHEFTITVANPVALPRREVVVFDVDLPLDFPTFFHEGFRSQNVKSFTLHGIDGEEIPYQRLSVDPVLAWRSRFAVPASIGDSQFTRYTVAAELDLPALGFTSLVVKPSATPQRPYGSLRSGPNSAENEHLALAVQASGAISITDKATGETYSDLLTFEDRSEIGDGWFHGDSVTDEIALSTANGAQVSVVHDGPEMVTFRIGVNMDVPARFDWHKEKRSDERTVLKITSLVSLRRGASTVEVETVVDNNVEDHRLRLLLPTDVRGAETYLAQQPYDVLERRIAVDRETTTWQEMELAEKPFVAVQSVGAGKRGLAFLSGGGLHEGGVADDARRTMLVTLLRSFRRTVGTEGEHDGLELGEIVYRYALMPFAGDLPRARALTEAMALQAGLMVRQTGQIHSGYPAMKGQQAPRQGYVEQERGTLVLSTFKPAEDGEGMVVRLWNPTDEPQRETLAFWRPVASAQRLTLAEQADPGPTPVVAGKRVSFEAGPKQVVTIGLTFGE